VSATVVLVPSLLESPSDEEDEVLSRLAVPVWVPASVPCPLVSAPELDPSSLSTWPTFSLSGVHPTAKIAAATHLDARPNLSMSTMIPVAPPPRGSVTAPRGSLQTRSSAAISSIHRPRASVLGWWRCIETTGLPGFVRLDIVGKASSDQQVTPVRLRESDGVLQSVDSPSAQSKRRESHAFEARGCSGRAQDGQVRATLLHEQALRRRDILRPEECSDMTLRARAQTNHVRRPLARRRGIIVRDQSPGSSNTPEKIASTSNTIPARRVTRSLELAAT